jgi:drug/metabolite transporter (DMT)-like permease
VLLLIGIARLSALSSALLLNLEGPLTMLLAVALFGEHLGRRAALSATLIVAGAVALTAPDLSLHRPLGDGWGAMAIVGACLLWALDNNLTQRLSVRDPVQIVRYKALAAGAANLAIAWILHASAPRAQVAVGALAIGVMSYGASIVLDVYALRLLGAAREAAYFATAPFLGALGAVLLVGDRLRAPDVVGGGLMALGVLLLLSERHAHRHAHEALEHDHLHEHDEHHRHAHLEGQDPSGPHAHPHRHEPLEHSHPHVPDLHHRHRH